MISCRVALVNPGFGGSFEGVPSGLLYLGTALEEAGHTATFHDLSTHAGGAEAVLADRPDIIAITSTSPSHFEALALAASIRRINKDVWIIKGGYHEKFGGAQFGSDNNTIDYAVTAAAGEFQMVELANARGAGRLPRAMSGLVSLGQARLSTLCFIDEPHKSSFTSLIPARHLIRDLGRYRYHGIFGDLKATQLLTFRGCRFPCSFCALSQVEDRHELEAVERDIRSLVSQGFDAVFIDDGTFTADWERAKTICGLLKRYGLMWACQTRIDVVDEEKLRFMAAAGCVYVYFGLESGSPRVLKSINKGFRAEQVCRVIGATRKLGLEAAASFIFGVPLPDGHDGSVDWMASVELIRSAAPTRVVPSIFAYYPGSPAWHSLSSEVQARNFDRYQLGADRESIWQWFDDGFGAVHHVDQQVAADIRGYLESRIPEFLWDGQARKTHYSRGPSGDSPHDLRNSAMPRDLALLSSE